MTMTVPTAAGRAWCAHLPEHRRLDEDGSQACAACGEALTDIGLPANLPEPEGATDPETGDGNLVHIPWPPGPNTRPYTPEDVEHEIVDTMYRLDGGARFQAARERELVQAKLEYDLAYASAISSSTERSADRRRAAAMLACQDAYVVWQRYEQVVRTTRESMHTLRSKLSGLQTINRSVSASSGGR